MEIRLLAKNGEKKNFRPLKKFEKYIYLCTVI